MPSTSNSICSLYTRSKNSIDIITDYCLVHTNSDTDPANYPKNIDIQSTNNGRYSHHYREQQVITLYDTESYDLWSRFIERGNGMSKKRVVFKAEIRKQSNTVINIIILYNMKDYDLWEAKWNKVME